MSWPKLLCLLQYQAYDDILLLYICFIQYMAVRGTIIIYQYVYLRETTIGLLPAVSVYFVPMISAFYYKLVHSNSHWLRQLPQTV